MSRGLLIALLSTVTLLLSSAPGSAGADDGDEGDFDRIDRADTLMAQAVEAADAGDWAKARELAETVLTLDDGFATAPARLVLVRALEKDKQYDSALYELREYFELELPDDQREAGARLEARIQARKDGTYRRPRRAPPRNRQVAAGVVLMATGALPAVVGGVFVANDVRWALAGVPSGTWAAIGAPLLAVGATLDIVGLVMLVRSTGPRAQPAALRRRPRPSVGLSVGRRHGGWQLGVVGRW